MSPTTERPYHLGRTERRGAVLGWRPGQAAAVAVGATVLVAGVSAGGTGVAVGLLGAVLGCVVAAVPVAGRGLDEWVPVAVCFVGRPRRGALCAGASVQQRDGEAPAHLRWPDGRATVVAVVRHRGLRALGDDPRGFGEALAGWLRGHAGVGAPRWTVTLLTSTGPGHPVRTASWADPGAVARAFIAVTASSPAPVAEVLGEAGVVGAVELDHDELDALLSSRVSPIAGTLLGTDLVARWHHVEAPASVHAAFTVEEWTAGDVDEQVLAPLCVARDRRTIAISLRVEELRRARDRTARVRTAGAADQALSANAGFVASAEAERDAARDDERAAELAAGHGALRLVGVVALDASDPLELEAAAARLVADAAACGLRLRRCDGDHRRGLLASVPGWVEP